jgi:hypothetical protein
LVGRSRGSHTNLTLPLQFRHPGPPFLTLLRPAGHPQNGPKFLSVGHREVTRTSRCLFSFINWARSSRPFYALRATPKTALNFCWLVDRSVTGKSHECHAASSVSSPGPTLPVLSTPCGPPPKRPLILVGRSQGSHMNITLSIQFRHQGLPFPTLLRPAGHPQNDLKFWLVGRLVGRSRGSHTNVTLPLQFCHPGPPFPTFLRPAGHPQNGL